MKPSHDGASLRLQRAELVAKRNHLYDVEAFLSAAGRVLIRVPGEPIPEFTWDGIYRTCEDVRLRTEAIQQRVDEIDLALAGVPE